MLFSSIESTGGAAKHFSLFIFLFFVFLIESTMQAVEFFSPVFFLSFLYLNAFPFASCFLLLQQCGLKRGFNLSSFYEKKNKNLFNWSHQVLSLQTYFSASHIMISSCKPKGQSLTLNPNANSNAKVKVITKSHCTDDVGALSMHKPTRAFERGSDVHLTESDKVTPKGKRGSKSQLRE